MFHRQPAAVFEEVLAINLLGSIRLARAAMRVMRPAGYGRIILVASTGGLHGDIELSAYAASKGGLLAFGTVELPSGASLSAACLTDLLAESGRGEPREFGVSADAFTDLCRSGRLG